MLPTVTLFLLTIAVIAIIEINRVLSVRYVSVCVGAGHAIASVYYWHYSVRNPNAADSVGYYTRALSGDYTWTPGTDFVIAITASAIEILGVSFFSLFTLFGFLGMIGVILLLRALDEVSLMSRIASFRGRLVLWCVISLPGLHFWTCAPGKDSLAFLSIGLWVWAMVVPWPRLPILAGGLMLLCAVRPHIGVIAIFATSGALVLSHRSYLFRLATVTLSVASFFSFLPFVVKYVGLESLSFDDVGTYVEARQGSNQDGDTSVNITEYGMLMMLVSFLFRPLFFDAAGFVWLIASVENAFLIYLVSLGLRRCRAVWQGATLVQVRMIILLAIFNVVCLAILAPTTANLGIAVRQKVMLYPGLFLWVFIALARQEHPWRTMRLRSMVAYSNLGHESRV